ncbi:HEPN domain protein [uncultured archaeon]|nr:HEPN domain protein [uncultured archaeon]
MSDAEITELIKKAKESLGAAKQLLQSGYSDFSASRSYYSMFYAAQALLLTKNLAFSKHSGVISAFGKEFIKNGLLPATLHHFISEAFDIRQVGDYGHVGSVSEETALILIDQAKEFIETIEKYLEKVK